MSYYKELIAELRKWQTLGDAPVGNGFGVIVDKLTQKQAADAIEQLGKDNAVLTKERDAAIADLKSCCVYNSDCAFCKHYFSDDAAQFCEEGDSCGNWEWRGVQEDK